MEQINVMTYRGTIDYLPQTLKSGKLIFFAPPGVGANKKNQIESIKSINFINDEVKKPFGLTRNLYEIYKSPEILIDSLTISDQLPERAGKK
jgi:hypothetical protein